jgi:type IV pilus assembly protein PilB
MVGEVRDGETAGLAIQAALTGHMVFSTLHTNNAATTLPRLLDMGIEPFLISSTIRAVVGQRLIRKLHKDSRQSYTPTEEEINEVSKMFGLTSPDDWKTIHELEKQAKAAGLGGDTPLSTDEHGPKTLWRANKDFTDDDVREGYRGRVGIYEVLYNSSAIQKLIMSHATSEEIQAQAVREGMITMQLDGLVKALRGETDAHTVANESKMFGDLDYTSHDQRAFGYPYPIKACHDRTSMKMAERVALRKQIVDAAVGAGMKRGLFKDVSIATGHA